MSENMARGLDWTDSIENDTTFVLLPEGDYEFEVVAFERGRHNGSAKLPPCNKAVLTLEVGSDQAAVQIKHNLFLHTKTEGMLCAFFTAIGQRRHGEKLQMNWNTVVGSRGRCKVGIREWTKESGEPAQSNEVKKFYEPDEGPWPARGQANKGYQEGTF